VGKSIRIYLADGVATGIRHGEITNWSGQGIACPRVRFPELKEWPETRRPGVYILFGADPQNRDAAYIGEAEDLFDRVKSHVQEKEFWNELVAFTSKDDNLTKAHVRYLESQLYTMAVNAGRYVILNSNVPQEASLPRSDRDAMKEFVGDIRVLLGVFGHRLLDPLTPSAPQLTADVSPAGGTTVFNGLATSSGLLFYLRMGKLLAKAVRGDEGLIVLAGSEAAKDFSASLSGGYKAKREKMQSDGILEQVGLNLRFAQDYPFSSPSQAAAIVAGYSVNGREAWKTESGKTYNEVEQAQTSAL